MKKAFLLIIITSSLFITTSTWAAHWSNGIPCSSQLDNDCEAFVVEGASNFLVSMSDFYLLLNESELITTYGRENFDFTKAKVLIENIINNLKHIKEIYSQLYAQLKTGTFDSVRITTLKTFDYDKFTNERKLHPLVMEKVKNFLSIGNMPGYVLYMSESIDSIIIRLLSIKKSVDSYDVPNIDSLRELHQVFSDSMLMGIYSSMLFSISK